MALVPCPSCSRHVATHETTCPFCASALPSDLESRAIPGTNRRLSRIATATFVTTLVVGAAAACSSSSGSLGLPYGAPPQDDGGLIDDGGSAAHYGAPSFDSGSADAGEDAD